MGFVHDDELWGDGEKVGSVSVTLDVVEADNDHWVVLENRDTGRKVFFQAGHT